MNTTTAPATPLDLLEEWTVTGDCYQRPVALILTSRLFTGPGRGLDGRITGNINARNHEIGFGRILDEPWSSGERVMLRLAWSLWNDGTTWMPSDLALIDPGLASTALRAIAIRAGVA